MLQLFFKWLFFRGIGCCIAFHPKCCLYQRRGKGAHACIFWKCGTTLSFLPQFYYIRLLIRVKAMGLLFVKKNWKFKCTGAFSCFGNCPPWYKLWLGPFSKHRVLGALWIFILRAHISCSWWTICKWKVSASKLEIDKFSCDLGESWYFIVLLLFPVERGFSRYSNVFLRKNVCIVWAKSNWVKQNWFGRLMSQEKISQFLLFCLFSFDWVHSKVWDLFFWMSNCIHLLET